MNVDVKVFEIRDRGTTIPWLAFRFAYPMSEKERRLLGHAGYGPNACEWAGVIQGRADCGGEDSNSGLHYDVYAIANDRTREAALFIEKRFDDLTSGQVIDVRVILGEAADPVESDFR